MTYRPTTATALALVLAAAALAGCSSNTQADDAQASASPSTAASPSSPAKDADSAGSGDEAMDDDGAPVDEAEGSPLPEPLALGQSAATIGGQSYQDSNVSGGELTLTPTSVVWSQGEGSTWASVVVRSENTGTVPATQVAPVDGGSWSVLDLDARTQASTEYYHEADQWKLGRNVVLPGFVDTSVESVRLPDGPPAGKAQLLYVDGGGAMFVWDLPATDTGPEAGELAAYITERQDDDLG